MHGDFKMSEDKFLGNLYQRFPVTVDRGIGAHVWDTNNKEYIDLSLIHI